MNSISKLCTWYANQSPDDWQEVRIVTIDNPGWSLKVDLEGTALSPKPFAEIRRDSSDTDSLVARKTAMCSKHLAAPQISMK